MVIFMLHCAAICITITNGTVVSSSIVAVLARWCMALVDYSSRALIVHCSRNAGCAMVYYYGNIIMYYCNN